MPHTERDPHADCGDSCPERRSRFRWPFSRKGPAVGGVVLSEPEQEGTLILSIHKGRKQASALLDPAEAQQLSAALARWARANGGG